MSNTLKKLEKLGDRGLIIAEAVSDEEINYYFVLEREWRAKPVEPGRFAALKEAGAAVGRLPGSKGAFVDFVSLRVNAATPEEEAEVTPRDPPTPGQPEEDGIVIHLDDDKYFSVAPEDWQKNPLLDGSEGDAGTLVDRGAIAANIPNDSIPIGTYCVLVNLALLNKPR